MASSHRIANKVREYVNLSKIKNKRLLIAWAIPDYSKNKFSPGKVDPSYDQVIILIPTNSDHDLWKKWTKNNDKEWFEAESKMKSIGESSSNLY